MNSLTAPSNADVIGGIPGRMAFAGGWIDQPFVSRHNPEPPGSMVVVGLELTFLNPLGEKHLEPDWMRRLGQTGKNCYDAILAKNVRMLGSSMNECMECWEFIMPHIVRHSTIEVDLLEILHYYQSRYPGAMYSGCGGGYLYVVSEEPVPGEISVQVRCRGRKE